MFVKDRKDNKWYGISANLFLEATHYAPTRKKINVDDFFWNFYETEKKGTGYVVGNLREKQELIIKGKAYLQPITIKGHSIVTIDRYRQFFIRPIIIRKSYDNLLKNWKHLGKYLLNDEVKKQRRDLYPGFVFNELARFARFLSSELDGFGSTAIIFMKKN